MENCLNKYFADEFTSDEKTEFLIEVENNERLKEEFIENQNLLALVDWISPEYENNKEVVQHKLYEFMRRMEQHKDKQLQDTMSKIYIILLTVFFYANVYSQQAYFVDGYHGGIYGHYPVKWKTQFIVDQLAMHPDWRICMEIEPFSL